MSRSSKPVGQDGPTYRLYRTSDSADRLSWVGFDDARALASYVASSFSAEETLAIERSAPGGSVVRVACRAADVAAWRPGRAPLPDGAPDDPPVDESAARLLFLQNLRRAIDAGEAAGVLSRIQADAFALAALDLVGRPVVDPVALASLISPDPPGRSASSPRRPRR